MDDYHQLRIKFLSKKQESLLILSVLGLILVIVLNNYFWNNPIELSYFVFVIEIVIMLLGTFVVYEYKMSRPEKYMSGYICSDLDPTGKLWKIRTCMDKFDSIIIQFRKSSYLTWSITFLVVFGAVFYISILLLDILSLAPVSDCIYDLHVNNKTKAKFNACLINTINFNSIFYGVISITMFGVAQLLSLWRLKK